jgi:hypothetical protein
VFDSHSVCLPAFHALGRSANVPTMPGHFGELRCQLASEGKRSRLLGKRSVEKIVAFHLPALSRPRSRCKRCSESVHDPQGKINSLQILA